SPIGKQPRLFGIKLHKRRGVTFAQNDVAFTDPTGCDHDAFSEGLRKAVYNYMHGIGLDADPRSWFARRRGHAKGTAIPRPKVPPDLIQRALTG
ncbi:MAG: radical SAM protein, partial [Kofleriaceae bacterium]